MLELILVGAVCAIGAYLLGSLSSAIIVTLLMYHKDIRDYGSGNAGMTNVLRTFGKGAAGITLLGDVLKGVIAVLLARWAFGAFTDVLPIYGAYLAAIGATLGHVYPLYFRFKGGKAVSVSIGAVFAIHPLLALPLVATFAVVFLCTKMVSLASICGALLYPFVTFFYFILQGHDVLATTLCAAAWAGFVVWLHRGNIKRIVGGTEYRFGQKKQDIAQPIPPADGSNSQ